MDIPTKMVAWEELGRGVYSSRYARRCRQNRIPVKVFLERLGTVKVSVDRLTIAPISEVIDIAKVRAADRDGTFHGWAIATVEAVSSNNRTVVASPIADVNPYHADIVLPSYVADDREEQTRHAQELADLSHWREYPSTL